VVEYFQKIGVGPFAVKGFGGSEFTIDDFNEILNNSSNVNIVYDKNKVFIVDIDCWQ
jgi:hypothetical protein